MVPSSQRLLYQPTHFQRFPFDAAHRFPQADLVHDLGFENMQGTVAPDRTVQAPERITHSANALS